MSDQIVYHFEWDPAKARANVIKHGVTFQRATQVFRDPFALSVYDEDHSDAEERWATLGLTEDGEYLVAIHTWTELGGADIGVRIISAQKATKTEIKQYQSAPRERLKE